MFSDSDRQRTSYEAAEAQAFGISDTVLRAWWPYYPLEIYWARKHDVPLEQVRQWTSAGARVQDVVRAQDVDVSLDDVQEWMRHGFVAADAIDAAESGMTLEIAVQWRRAGFMVLDAILLIEDGWTLATAERARYSEVRPSPEIPIAQWA